MHEFHPSNNAKVAVGIFVIVALFAFAFLQIFASYPSSAPAYPTVTPEPDSYNTSLPTPDATEEEIREATTEAGSEADTTPILDTTPALPLEQATVEGAITTGTPPQQNRVLPSLAVTP